MRLEEIIEFLAGFFGMVFFVWFLAIGSRHFGLNDFSGAAVIAFGLIFFLYFMFLLGKSTEKMPGFFSRAKLNKDAYFTKGWVFFVILFLGSMIILGIWYAIIPGLLWIWSGE